VTDRADALWSIGLFVPAVGERGGRQSIMWVAACDEAKPTHKTLTIFRKFVEIGDPALLTAELLGLPSMPNETELSTTISAFCHCGLRFPLLWRSHQREAQLAAVSS